MNSTYEPPVCTKGKIFLVGNGPSQNEIDLDKLIGHESWGCNRIHLIYDTVKWRPTRWWWGDHPQREWQLREIFWYVEEFAGQEMWLRSDICEMLDGRYRPYGDDFEFYDECPECVKCWDKCTRHAASQNTERDPGKMHWIAPAHLCKPGSTIGALFQQAVWEGYGEIYLIGCDAGFTPRTNPDTPPTHHMVDGYYDNAVTASQADCDSMNNMLKTMHRQMQEFADSREDVAIYTLAGKIEAHPRRNFDDVI